MSAIGKWLLPFLTGLIVLASALLPSVVSEARDVPLTAVHTEPLQTENDLPTLPLSLPERMELLARYHTDSDSVTNIWRSDVSLDDADLRAMVSAELARLADAEILPIHVTLDSPSDSPEVIQLYLRMPGEVSGANFYLVTNYSATTEATLQLTLDEVSGCALTLEYFDGRMRKFPVLDPETIGRQFLDRLGVENKCVDGGPYGSFHRLPETSILYVVCVDEYLLRVEPLIEMEADGSVSVSPGDVTDSDAKASTANVG